MCVLLAVYIYNIAPASPVVKSLNVTGSLRVFDNLQRVFGKVPLKPPIKPENIDRATEQLRPVSITTILHVVGKLSDGDDDASHA